MNEKLSKNSIEIFKNAPGFCRLYLASFAVTLLAFFIFLPMHYSVDSYSVFFEKTAYIHLKQSRYLNYFIGELLLHFGINTVKIQSILTLILILSISYCIARISNYIISFEKESYISQTKCCSIWLNILIGFINVFILEFFLYPEITLYFSIALISATEAVLILVSKKGFFWYSIAFILVNVSLFSYQATLPMILIYFIGITIIKNEFNLSVSTFRKIFIGILPPFLSCVLLLLLQKLFHFGGDRDASLNMWHLLANAKEILFFQKNLLIDQLGFWPSYILLIILCFFIVYILISVYKNKSSVKSVVYMFVIIVFQYAIIFAPHLLTRELWLAERTLIGFWTFISVVGLYIYYTQSHISHPRQKALVYIFGFILFVNICSIWIIGKNHIQSNREDYQYVQEIQKSIDIYERQSGNEVKYIATCKDQSFQYSYPDIKYVYGDTNTKCFSVDWGDVTAINYYTGKDYMKISMDQSVYDQYFANRDWNEFIEDEQMVFKDEYLYLCLY